MGCCESIESENESEENQGFNPAVRSQQNIRARVVRPPSRVWDIHELLAETEKIDAPSARNIVHLFENHNTIPFICRYRRDLITQNITPDRLRDIKNTYTHIIYLRKRAEAIISELEKVINISAEVRAQILGAKTVKELEFLHSVYTPSNENIRRPDLEVHALRLLLGDSPPVQLQFIIDRKDPHFDTFEKVNAAMCCIISDHFSKHAGVLDELRRLQKIQKIILKCSKVEDNPTNSNSANISAASTNDSTRNDQSKYERYFNFENGVQYIKPHQALAINRGERYQFLAVSLTVPCELKNYIRSYIHTVFMCNGLQYALRNEIFEQAFEQCYSQKLMPLLYKQVRTDLTEAGKKAALEGFAKNLKQLLLMPPLKGERILGIDPGFKNGCKMALISEMADVLEVGIVYPHNEHNNPDKCGIKLANMLAKHRCKRIALGNGTACRETEAWLRKLFDSEILDRKNVRYDIVSEQGASVYSCSKEAKKEFPNLDANLISAVSIARRLNDPLSEFVKIEPRHLGIGMYQHDISAKFLSKSLNEVVSECVSYVGVDINTASLSLLRHIAGLNEKRAENIIEYRQKKGPFRTRKDLLKVKTVGEKSFLQCAGFIRIEPKSVGGKVINVLDCTCVHPESYSVAIHIIEQCNLLLEDVGKPEFISKIKAFAESHSTDTLANRFDIPIGRLQVVLASLQRQLFQDYRSDKFDEKPLFKADITQIEELFIGEIVTGEVRNMVDFGAFVDIGLEANALIHKNKMNGIKLKLGDRVVASVLDIDINRKHVELRLDELI